MTDSLRGATFKASWLYGQGDMDDRTKPPGTTMPDNTNERGFTERKESPNRLSVTYTKPPSIIVEEVSTKDGRNGCYAVSKQYMENTTAHGVPRVVQSKSTFGRIIWSLICIGAMTAFLVQTSFLIKQYLKYQVNNKVRVVSVQSLIFPSITVCNTNKLRKSAIRQSPHANILFVDEGNILPYYSPCLPGDFACNDGIACIKPYLLCDGIRQCSTDGSDETGCVYGTCGNNQFRCPSGSPRGPCIPLRKQCDKESDCYEGEDEMNCECRLQEFKCTDAGNCLEKHKVCDGELDCGDGSDEENCPENLKNCANGFLCDRNATCIANGFKCDGSYDCVDRTDEDNCNVGVIVPEFCTTEQFRCTGGQCIPIYYLCDGSFDCLDHSDEHPDQCGTAADKRWRDDNRCGPYYPLPDGSPAECDPSSEGYCCSTSDWCGNTVADCECSGCIDYRGESGGQCGLGSLFMCPQDGRCLSDSLKCNGVLDCIDGFDEQNCECFGFDCLDQENKCIPTGWVCDGLPDCLNGADELECGAQEDCDQEFTESSGTIYSPNYGGEYPVNNMCTITVNTGNMTDGPIEFTFTEIDLEGNGCSYDYVQVRRVVPFRLD